MQKGRNTPAMIVAILGGALISMLAGLLLASYAVAGVSPSYLATPTIREARVVSTDPDPFSDLSTVQQINARLSVARPVGQDL